VRVAENKDAPRFFGFCIFDHVLCQASDPLDPDR
jgi:hypothetical protein